MDNKAGGEQCVHCREVVRCSECPLSEVPLYTAYLTLCITMTKDREDPFYLVDLGHLLELHTLWKTALPGVHPFYAVKCNNDPALLQTLAALGCGFDCASKVTNTFPPSM